MKKYLKTKAGYVVVEDEIKELLIKNIIDEEIEKEEE